MRNFFFLLIFLCFGSYAQEVNFCFKSCSVDRQNCRHEAKSIASFAVQRGGFIFPPSGVMQNRNPAEYLRERENAESTVLLQEEDKCESNFQQCKNKCRE